MKLAACASLLAASLLCGAAYAQIYECVGEDGTRVFSDERCGPDAKVVRGVTSKKRSTPPSEPRPKPPPKAASELEALSERCDAGDMKACKEWTLSGGPNLLREKERSAERECEAGSLSACEERYCREGMNPDCRARVLRTAKLAGEDWYLREQEPGAEGRTVYRIRCVPEGGRSRDVEVSCASLAGPNRCTVGDAQQGFARLDRAAAQVCAR
jgi:hypothetical protein